MELKDFIKSVLFDVTEAVKECQEELKMEQSYHLAIVLQRKR